MRLTLEAEPMDLLFSIEPRRTVRKRRIESIKVVRRGHLRRTMSAIVVQPFVTLTHHQQPIVVLQSIHLVQEERPIVIGDQRVDILEDDEAGGLPSSPFKDRFDTCG